MIKLHPETKPEFVSDLSTEITTLFREKYNRPIKSGRFINELSEIFGSKDWNTLSSELSLASQKCIIEKGSNIELNQSVINLQISKDLMMTLLSDKFSLFWNDKDKIKVLYEDNEVSNLYDVIYYQFGLEYYIEAYALYIDYNSNEIPQHYLDKAYSKYIDTAKNNLLSDVNETVKYRAIQEMMTDLLIDICQDIEKHCGDDHKDLIKLNSNNISNLFSKFITKKTGVPTLTAKKKEIQDTYCAELFTDVNNLLDDHGMSIANLEYVVEMIKQKK